MTVYLQDTDLTLHHGDCLEVLRKLPDRSVHMCATSPPFYGLRDYGTGEWEGGDPDCNHSRHVDYGEKSDTNRGSIRGGPMGQTCGKCGARRVDQQIGLEETPDQWVERLVAVFREVRRVLRDDGTLWVEIGDSYAASWPCSRRNLIGEGSLPNGKREARPPRLGGDLKTKDLIGGPWLLAFALRADGWYLRSEIIWARPNPMPESVTDRPTKSHSTVFLLSKKSRYFFDSDAIREPHARIWDSSRANGSINNRTRDASGIEPNPAGANCRSVWNVATQPTPFAHFATWPQKLVARMILAGTSERGCCPECGAPWVRDVDKGFEAKQAYDNGQRYASMDERHAGGWKGSGRTVATTLGWSPSCAHDTTPVPCTVLDPFAGSGTTLLVARQHGRHSIGIELNQTYCELVRDRTSQQSLLADVS